MKTKCLRILAVFFIAGSCSLSLAQTPPNFKIAFIGDQSLGSNAVAVLNLIKNEGASAVVHAGDFDYSDDPPAWDAQINSVLGANFPYFASVGNHDESAFYGAGGYQSFLAARMNRLGITWDGDLGVLSSFIYNGIFILLTGPDVLGTGHDIYIRDKLAADNSIWSISSWHKNMEAMQIGGKSDEAGWGVYEESRKGGAIIATAHEHSYERTHLLSSCQFQIVASTSNTLVLAKDLISTSTVDEGRSFVFVSGLGGNSVRDQERCFPTTPPYGCNGEWASIYTSNQGATYGALFGVFNFNGDPTLAHFYFKAINGAVPDDFFVRSAVESGNFILTVNTAGSGTVALNPPGGIYPPGTVVTLTATPATGWTFSGWSGDLTGSNNPAMITMNANKTVTANFTFSGGSGQVVYEETKTGGSSNSTTVRTSASLTGVSGHLYLAAIATRSNVAVSAVTGLGLTWTRVRTQCSGRNQTGVELWKAQGTTTGNGRVTATLASTPSNAVIAVSRYSGVDPATPLGNLVSGNTNGVNGACSGGVNNASYSFNVTTTINGAMVYGAAAMRNRTHTPGAGYTERAEIKRGSSGENQASVAVEDQSVASPRTLALNGSFSGNVDWAVIGGEIKPQLNVSTPASLSAREPATDFVQASSYRLEQNYPNPFNPGTNIRYSLPQAGQVRLTIYDLHGQIVSAPLHSFQKAGTHIFNWQAEDAYGHALPSGVYFYRLEAGSQTQTKRMILLR